MSNWTRDPRAQLDLQTKKYFIKRPHELSRNYTIISYSMSCGKWDLRNFSIGRSADGMRRWTVYTLNNANGCSGKASNNCFLTLPEEFRSDRKGFESIKSSGSPFNWPIEGLQLRGYYFRFACRNVCAPVLSSTVRRLWLTCNVRIIVISFPVRKDRCFELSLSFFRSSVSAAMRHV